MKEQRLQDRIFKNQDSIICCLKTDTLRFRYTYIIVKGWKRYTMQMENVTELSGYIYIRQKRLQGSITNNIEWHVRMIKGSINQEDRIYEVLYIINI